MSQFDVRTRRRATQPGAPTPPASPPAPPAPAPSGPAATGADLAELYRTVRETTDWLCEPLAVEDYVAQSLPHASPVKWHLAHTSWFFETFVLMRGTQEYRPFHPQFEFLFNSHYNAVGPQFARAQRGLLTRPTLSEIRRYRAHVDREMNRLFATASPAEPEPGDRRTVRHAEILLHNLITLGLHHEQQHQELIVAGIKHLFSCNPLHPVYRQPGAAPLALAPARKAAPRTEAAWVQFPEAIREIGYGGRRFAFDNELPRHKVFVPAFQIADRLVTNAEYRAFIDAGGYRRAGLWLADGWQAVRAGGWTAPLYWEDRGGEWWTFTLGGLTPVRGDEPVSHISFYEADAYARWVGARLPTEAEWETAAAKAPVEGNLLESDSFQPQALSHVSRGEIAQLFGDVWEWTASAYAPYPGFRPARGAPGEYNAKFMSGQMVLRGGSCATPRSHIRATYRNSLPPDVRWHFSGVRLARDF